MQNLTSIAQRSKQMVYCFSTFLSSFFHSIRFRSKEKDILKICFDLNADNTTQTALAVRIMIDPDVIIGDMT